MTELDKARSEDVRCERHGERTRLRCAECGVPICPRCMVRTDVGIRCERCGAAPEVRRTDRRPAAVAVAAAGLVLIAAALAAALFLGDGDGGGRSIPVAAVGGWTEGPSLQQVRGSTRAVTLADGTVAVVGGGLGSIPISATELYDADARTWTSSGRLVQARRGHGAVLLDDGDVLVAGGIAAGRLLDSSEMFDPDTQSWSRTAPMADARLGHTMTTLADGTVLVTGGSGETGRSGQGSQTVRPSASAEIFDPKTQRWTPVGNMTVARFEHTATLLSDGRVLIAGGVTAEGESLVPVASAELYDPASRTFSRTGALTEPRSDHAAATLGDGRVLVVGGDASSRPLASAEAYDPARGTWSQLEPLRQPRRGHSATLLEDGSVLVAGGEFFSQGTRTSLTDAERYVPRRDVWSDAGSMRCPRSEHGAALLADGSVLIAGGDAVFPGEPPIAQSCVDVYSP